MNKNIFDYNLEQTANILQILSFLMLVQQTSADDIMKDMQKQDKILNEQTEVYLKKIVEQNELIIKQNKEILQKLE